MRPMVMPHILVAKPVSAVLLRPAALVLQERPAVVLPQVTPVAQQAAPHLVALAPQEQPQVMQEVQP